MFDEGKDGHTLALCADQLEAQVSGLNDGSKLPNFTAGCTILCTTSASQTWHGVHCLLCEYLHILLLTSSLAHGFFGPGMNTLVSSP